MPVRNEIWSIGRSLKGVIEQDYPPDRTEILVVDGMSDDGTREMVQRFISQRSNLKLVDNPGKIVPVGLNVVLPRTRGDVIIRVDGHCEIAPDYVRRCVEHILFDKVDGVGGSVETIGETPLAQNIAVAMSSAFGVGNSAFRTQQGKTKLADTVPFAAYTRAIIKRAGFYDEELVRNQDDEYNYRIRKLGGKVLLAADVKSKYYSRSSLAELWRQYLQYGYWKVRVLQKHPRQMRPRQLVPVVFVASILGTAMLSLFHPVGRYLLAFVLAAYLLANLVASIWMSSKRGWKHLPLLPIIYAILHLSYGLGFLIGLVRFIHRWGDKKGKVPEWKPGELGSAGAGGLADAD